MTRGRQPADGAEERPPICPACGVTQGIVVDDDDARFVCLECGFSEEAAAAGEEAASWRR